VSAFFDLHLRKASHNTFECNQQKSEKTTEVNTEQLPEAS